MNEKIAKLVNLYSGIVHKKLAVDRLETELNCYVAELSEQEMGEYLEATYRIDARVEAKQDNP